jgi:dTMP kinase
MLIAFEGLDQSGKETQARRLGARLEADGHRVHPLSFPAYDSPIGRELRQALTGGRDFGPEVMQLLYVANRFEFKPDLDRWLSLGDMVVCDRYRASSVAYGEAQGLDAGWLADIQRHLPAADLTILLDIAPETAVRRKAEGRDSYERDLGLLARVRESYHRQARASGWIVIDGEAPREAVSSAIETAVRSRLAPPSAPARSTPPR